MKKVEINTLGRGMASKKEPAFMSATINWLLAFKRI